MKNILLVGATGYLGSCLTKSLVSSSYNVIVLKRKTSSLERIKHLSNKIELFDIEELDFDELFCNSKIDIIINTVASYGKKGEKAVDVYNSNLIFPLLIMEYAIKYKVSFFINANTTLPENLNFYALSKKQFAQILKVNSDKINTIDMELQYFYGPGDDDSKFVTYIIKKIKSGVDSIDLSAGTQIRDFIYIDDVVNAYLLIIKNIELFSGYTAVPLGSGKGISLKNLSKKIKKHLKNKHTELNFGALPTRPREIMYSVANIKFLKTLGWAPQYTIDQGLEKTII